MAFSSVWLFHLYGVFLRMAFSSVWGFLAYGFCPWVLPVGFHLWVISSVGYFICGLFHLWVISSVDYFICGLFHLWVISSVGYFICGLFHLWFISSVVYFICELFHLWIFLRSMPTKSNIFSTCMSNVEHFALGVSSNQKNFILVVARELILFNTSEFSKHLSIRHYTCLIKPFVCEIYCT
jgi:hypothetical protein